jgi:hypothetical protein
MSARNGDKARFQKNRKRSVLRRAKVRAMIAATAGTSKAPAPARRAKG